LERWDIFFDVQIFKDNHSLFMYKHPACFMKEIIALITNFSRECRKPFPGTAAFVFSMAGLTLFQFLFSVSKIRRIQFRHWKKRAFWE